MTNQERLSQRLAELSPEKRALLQRKLMEKRAATVPQGVRRRTTTGPCPLSFGQELMWLLDQLTPGISAYNVPRIHRMEGPLDVEALNRALNEVLRRHDILRTTYEVQGSQAVQVIAPFAPTRLSVIDLSHLDAARREEEVSRIAIEWADRGFDLARDSLLRMGLLRLGEQEHVLMLISHHIASDGWSKGLLFRGLEALYAAFCAGQPSPLPEPALQYADFAVWQRDYLKGEVLEKLLGHWKQHLEGAPPLLDLPTDHPRPAVQSGRGKRLGTRFPQALAESLKAVGAQEGATLFMVGLAASYALFYRYTGQEDLVLGTPISGRGRTELENVIGYFSNSLALRVSVAGDPTFRELLRRVRLVALDAFAYQEMPFEKLIVELNPVRTLSYTPIYQVMFSVGTGEMEDFHLEGLSTTTLFADRGTAKFDMAFGLRDSGDALLCGVEYSADLFEHASMERMLEHYRTLLEGFVASPDERISRLPLLPEAERNALLAAGRGPVQDFPLGTCLHQQFEAQAVRTPDAIAIEQVDRRLTYRQLDAQANQLARLLRQAGVGRGDFVAILQERGPDFLIAMLGTFKAGAAYVPVDPKYPRDRIQYLLERSEARTLLSHHAVVRNFSDLLAGCHSLRALVCFDDQPTNFAGTGRNGDLLVQDRAALAQQPTEGLANVNVATDPLYMIFTSGSTGLPKGVVIRHDGALNHIYAQFDALGLGGDFAFLQSAPSSSDISVWQFLAPVLTGGRVVVADEETLLTAEKLWATVVDKRVTIAELVPVLMQLLKDHAAGLPAERRSLPDLKWMMVTGEAAPVDLVNAWLQLFPQVPVVNAYGPTEAADDVIQGIIERPLPDGQRSVPIGRPLANLRIYVLDEHLQLVPTGVAGEICVGGIGVGVGYWKDEDRTRVAFVHDPFAGKPGARMYRTGDLGRWLPDGTIEFLGRRDGQVKVHGFRVELGEIEAMLRQHPAVKDAVVAVVDENGVVRPPSAGSEQLAAYIVPEREPPVAMILRDFLREKLPAHMVPARFGILERLPLTPSGKVDRKALPPAQTTLDSPEGAYQEPRTPFEQALAEIWQEVLGIERVGTQDNFFDLGGHSLTAMRVSVRIRETFGAQFTLRNVFEAPTVAAQALFLLELLSSGTLQATES
jgi:amino acid adenylation domain-containing protein